MPRPKDYAQYGNLMSYKHYTRPASYGAYGSSSTKNRTRHQDAVLRVLGIMFANGACSTWKIARLRLDTDDVSRIRAKEKEYRRLFLGRYDTKKRTGGMLELGLVVKETIKKKKHDYSRYRLSLHGILYCMDVLNPSEEEIDGMAQRYAGILPRIFGRWEVLRSAAGGDVYRLRVLARGLLLDSPDVADATAEGTPLYDLMSFVHVKYSRSFESISEDDLAEQISYWFYTFLLYYGAGPAKAAAKDPLRKRAQTRIDGVKGMFRADAELRRWYREFFHQAKDHYKKRLRTIMAGSRRIFD